MENQKDLFETPELIPAEIQSIFDAVSDCGEYQYSDLKEMLTECEKLGYTFDYYLDAEPYNLRQIAEPATASV